jgi:hypothetical protein
MTGIPANGSAQRLPLFYSRIEPLHVERHAALGLRYAGYGFARDATAIPLAAEEFGIASRTLPIVFAPEPPFLPVALLALVPGQSHAVAADGHWKQGVYVPAYVRRYPFILARTREGTDEMALCVDPTAAALTAEGGEKLFADGKPGPAVNRALDFARNFEVAMQRTRAMVDALAAADLLQPGAVQFQIDGQQRRVDGFRAMDRKRLHDLDAETFLSLRNRGYLEPIYAHLLSIGGVSELAREIALAR